MVRVHDDTIDCDSRLCQDFCMVTLDSNPPEWTIDELAADAGVPVRTIREYQRLELLPPPRRVGRVGKYTTEHRSRLSIIARLQERGYSLAAIEDLIGSWEQGRGLGSVLGVDANPAALDETPMELTMPQLERIVPAFRDSAILDAAISAGLLRRLDDGVVVRSLAAVEYVALAIEAGMPPSFALDVVRAIGVAAADIASTAVDQFMVHVWPRRDVVDLTPVLSRARLLLAQASASLVVHELGVALSEHSDHDASDQLSVLVDQIAIGHVTRLATHDEGLHR